MKYINKKQLGAMLLLLCLSGITSFLHISRLDRSGRIDRSRIVQELGSFRIIEGRLAGFKYAPFDEKKSQPTIRKKAWSLLREKRFQDKKSARSLVDNAVLRIYAQEDVVGTLDATDLNLLRDPLVLSDIAAIYMHIGEKYNYEAYLKALSAAKRSVSEAPYLPEAQFNFALALEKNYLRRPALKAWVRYLEVDGDSGWADEARRHINNLLVPSSESAWKSALAKLKNEIAENVSPNVNGLSSSFPQQIEDWVEYELLSGWTEANCINRFSVKNGYIASLLRMEPTLRAQSKDAFAADLLRSFGGIEKISDEQDRCIILERLGAAYDKYTQGKKLCLEDQSVDGVELLRKSQNIFQDLQNPMAEKALFYVSVCAYQSSDFEKVLSSIDKLREGSYLYRYPNLLGRTYWLAGMAQLSMFKPNLAVSEYRTALGIFRRTGNRQYMGAVCYLLAEALQSIGGKDEAWRYLRQGMDLTLAEGNTRRLYAAFDQLADQAQEIGELDAACYFREEVLRLARLEGDDPGMVHALVKRGESLLTLGKVSDAVNSITKARARVGDIQDPAIRERQEALLDVVEGKVLLDQSPRRAIMYLSKALETFYSQGYRVPMVETLALRALAYERTGNSRLAKEDLLAGIDIFEGERGNSTDYLSKIEFFAQAQVLFDRLISLELNVTGGGNSLVYAEQRRARVLLDYIVSPGDSHQSIMITKPSIELSEEAIPSQLAVVEYAWLQDRLVAWILRKGVEEIRVVDLSPAMKSIHGDIDELKRAVISRSPTIEFQEIAARLYDNLFLPIAPFLESCDTIVFIPDRHLHSIPFSALFNRYVGRYIVQDYAVEVAPSFTIWSALRRDLRSQLAAQPSLLALGNPHFKRDVFPSLSLLPKAEEEVAHLAEFYGSRAIVRVGNHATKSFFNLESDEFDVIHISSHALISARLSIFSGLLFAPDFGADDGMLYVHEIQNLKFSRAAVIYLASCDTAIGEFGDSEGPSSIARAFLAAGIPVAVASLWEVDDKISRHLAIEFHRRLVAGNSPVSALRDAQLSMIDSQDENLRSPYVWGSLEVVGGRSAIF